MTSSLFERQRIGINEQSLRHVGLNRQSYLHSSLSCMSTSECACFISIEIFYNFEYLPSSHDVRVFSGLGEVSPTRPSSHDVRLRYSLISLSFHASERFHLPGRRTPRYEVSPPYYFVTNFGQI